MHMSKSLDRCLLIAITISFCLTYADSTVLSIALPTIQHALASSLTTSLWIVNSYILARAVVTFAAGRVSDLFGHGKIFLYSLIVLAITSIFCALSANPFVLIIFRILQGISTTFIFISGLCILTTRSPDAKKARIISFVVGMAFASLAIAPVLGGILIKYSSWQTIFWANGFIAFLSLCLSYRKLTDETHIRTSHPFDWLGSLFSALFTIFWTIAFQNSSMWGWTSFTFMSCIVLGCLFFIMFCRAEAKHPHPIVNLSLFNRPGFLANCLIAGLTQVGIMFIVFVGLFLQITFHMSPEKTALFLLPMTITGIIFSSVGGWLADKYNARLPAILGTGTACVGFIVTGLLLLFHSSYNSLLPLLILSGMGLFMINGPIRIKLLHNAVISEHGMINAILNGSRAIITAIGFSITSSIITGMSHHRTNTTGFICGLCFVGSLLLLSLLLAIFQRQYQPHVLESKLKLDEVA